MKKCRVEDSRTSDPRQYAPEIINAALLWGPRLLMDGLSTFGFSKDYCRALCTLASCALHYLRIRYGSLRGSNQRLLHLPKSQSLNISSS
jgi:hypothetical protein